ncbi:hypothetical protein CDL60_04525 [Roseateles noduli]|nr:hypothetical protein CDL60_04525 [Roseateles noduli]
MRQPLVPAPEVCQASTSSAERFARPIRWPRCRRLVYDCQLPGQTRTAAARSPKPSFLWLLISPFGRETALERLLPVIVYSAKASKRPGADDRPERRKAGLLLAAAQEFARVRKHERRYSATDSDRLFASLLDFAKVVRHLRHAVHNDRSSFEQALGWHFGGLVSLGQRFLLRLVGTSDLLQRIPHRFDHLHAIHAKINQAITQMDQVTQQNAALVEESAAAANSLEAQAQRLAESVASFRVA